MFYSSWKRHSVEILSQAPINKTSVFFNRILSLEQRETKPCARENLKDLLGRKFQWESVTTTVGTGNFLRASLSLKFYFTLILLDEHCGIADWAIILTGKWQNKQETTQNEPFWQYKLVTVVPDSLSEPVVGPK